MVPIVRTGLVNRMTTYLFSLKVLKILLLVVAKGVNSVQVFHRKFSYWLCMWISHFSSVLIQQGWIRSTLSDYRSSFVCEICMLSTPLANNSREQSFGSQDYNDRNDQILIYLGIHNLYYVSSYNTRVFLLMKSINWLGNSADLSWSWLISAGITGVCDQPAGHLVADWSQMFMDEIAHLDTLILQQDPMLVIMVKAGFQKSKQKHVSLLPGLHSELAHPLLLYLLVKQVTRPVGIQSQGKQIPPLHHKSRHKRYGDLEENNWGLFFSFLTIGLP